MNGTGIDGYRTIWRTRRRSRPAQPSARQAERNSSQVWRQTLSARPITSIGWCSRGTCAAGDPSRASTGDAVFVGHRQAEPGRDGSGSGWAKPTETTAATTCRPNGCIWNSRSTITPACWPTCWTSSTCPSRWFAPPLRDAPVRQNRGFHARDDSVSSSWAPRKWRAASCSTSCAASVSNYSPTNPRWPHGSSGSTARSSPTKWATSATALRAAPPRSGRSCVGSTRGSDGCLRGRPTRSASSPIARELHALLDRPFDVEELTADLANETFLAAHP